MPLPSLSASRLAVIGLAVAGLGGLYGLFRWEATPVSMVKTRAEAPAVRRGDDPTYADELRTMTALLQDMRYRFEQTENQRIVDRERAERALREATQEAAQQSRQEVDRLNQALREAREAADQKIKELAASRQDPSLKREIDRLTEELNALRTSPPARVGGRAAHPTRETARARGGPKPIACSRRRARRGAGPMAPRRARRHSRQGCWIRGGESPGGKGWRIG